MTPPMSDLSIVEALQNAIYALEYCWREATHDKTNGPASVIRMCDERLPKLRAAFASTASEAERVREACAKVAEGVAQIIGAAPGSSIHSALCEAGAAIRSLPIGEA